MKRCHIGRKLSPSTLSANLNKLLLCFLGFHCFQPYYNFFLPVPPTCTLFLYFPALTGNGFACHVMLVTGCLMDGILVRALFCLRHATGQRHPATCTHTHHPTSPHTLPVTCCNLLASPCIKEDFLPQLSCSDGTSPRFFHLLVFFPHFGRRVSPCCFVSLSAFAVCICRYHPLITPSPAC